MKLYFATTNNKKYEEMKSLINIPLEQYYEDIIEIQGSSEEIAIHKVKTAFNKKKEDVIILIDDVSLELKALCNFPGPYIKDFLKIGYESIERIVKELGREAEAICTLAICYKKDDILNIHTVNGRISGSIINRKETNTEYFSFDKVFLPKGYNKTFSEMKLEEKNKISHRRVAVNKLIDLLYKLNLYEDIN